MEVALSEMYNRNSFVFYGMYSFILTIYNLKALMFYEVIRITYHLDLKKPFNNYVAKQIAKISYYTLSIGLLSFIARQTAIHLQDHDHELDQLDKFFVDSQAFILMAAVVYIIATIFRRGVEIQTENDLTV